MNSNLFNDLPLQFFRPLSGALAPMYWSVLRRLYELDFEGEPFEITHETAVEQAALILEQTPEFISGSEDFRQTLEADLEQNADLKKPESAMVADEREARQLARRILRRLEHCG